MAQRRAASAGAVWFAATTAGLVVSSPRVRGQRAAQPAVLGASRHCFFLDTARLGGDPVDPFAILCTTPMLARRRCWWQWPKSSATRDQREFRKSKVI
ncbi:hypothetical protein ACQPZF_17120 [Actinosynnema sp. CS-041913]|uniref:hypothetical protein n=1 Tax=Actinosynnema sp. CS-041913 TaxID=3239917 RepID=UPI003D93C57C